MDVTLFAIHVFASSCVSTGFTIDQKMEDLGREMVRHCGGLPLAVIVLGGILVTKKMLKEWEEVLQNIKRYLAKGEGMGKEYGGERGVSSLLDLSYNNLPYHLKPCFLYLANFPEDSDIEASRLYHLWVAERFISSDDRHEGETMMDVAEHYLGELAQRYMVQVCVEEKTETTRKSCESCRLHDLMRALCLTKVKEENFLKVIDSRDVEKKECSTSSSSSNISKTRRLAVHYSDEVGGYPTTLEKSSAQYVRSLLFFKGQAESWFKENNNVNHFKLLNVLYIGKVDMGGTNFPKALAKIMQGLRYFSLNSSRITELPPSLGKLGYVETLDLRTHSHELFIPNVLWKLKRLRHLYLPMSIKLLDSEKELKKLRLDSLNNLETLVNFHSRECDAKDLLKLNNLRKLDAVICKEREYLAYLVQAITSTSSLLRETDLYIRFCSFDSEEELNVLIKLLGCHRLNKLWLRGPISKLPESYSFSPNLIRLQLTDSELEDDPMPTLGKLPSLIHLEIRGDIFMGKEMVCSSTDFLQLKHLVIWYLPNLENMTVDQGAFPKLSYLEIWGCKKLKMIPNGITFLTALNELRIRLMTREFVDRLQVIDGKEGEDYHKIKHIPSIIF